eukprot:364791-Chlamydomonas_euryale.AAC.4
MLGKTRSSTGSANSSSGITCTCVRARQGERAYSVAWGMRLPARDGGNMSSGKRCVCGGGERQRHGCRRALFM